MTEDRKLGPAHYDDEMVHRVGRAWDVTSINFDDVERYASWNHQPEHVRRTMLEVYRMAELYRMMDDNKPAAGRAEGHSGDDFEMTEYQRPDDLKYYDSLRALGKSPKCSCPAEWRFGQKGQYLTLDYRISCPVHYPMTASLLRKADSQ